MTIKVGDKVEYIGSAYKEIRFGVVINVNFTHNPVYPYMVAFPYDDGYFTDLLCSEVELIKVTNGRDLWHNRNKS